MVDRKELARVPRGEVTELDAGFRRNDGASGVLGRHAERGPHPACRPPSPIAGRREKGLGGRAVSAALAVKVG